MAYVIGDRCIDVKDGSCVEVCPVDCIHPRRDERGFDAARQLHIDPSVCIDCDGCAHMCPVEAVWAMVDVPANARHSIQINAAYYG